METQKPLLKDEDGEEVDVHMYRSMIDSLMYLTSSRPDIMYLKGQPKLGLWYLKDSPFDLVAYTDSDYAGASLDRKSTIGGCQFLVCRLISWQCKKQTVVANSTTKAEYVAASSCCGQVLWIQNQLLDYGTMSSPNRSTSDIEDAFSSMNILNYTSVSSDYFPASSGSNPITLPAILTLSPPGKHRLMPMASDSNLTGTPCSENGNYKEFISCQPSLLMVRKAQ
ncbi:hypothetical protein Tco_0794222 [Tanacetum coccineum]